MLKVKSYPCFPSSNTSDTSLLISVLMGLSLDTIKCTTVSGYLNATLILTGGFIYGTSSVTILRAPLC